jgi:glycopeptide antibiotics resistance protein
MENIRSFILQNRKGILRALKVLFFLYLGLMIWEIFIGPYRSYSSLRRFNLYPFKTISNFLANSSRYSFHVLFINLAANIITFIPLGFSAPIFLKKIRSSAAMFAFSIIAIFAVEWLQFVLNVGVFDIDDIILNTLGCMLGFMFYQRMRKWYCKN